MIVYPYVLVCVVFQPSVQGRVVAAVLVSAAAALALYQAAGQRISAVQHQRIRWAVAAVLQLRRRPCMRLVQAQQRQHLTATPASVIAVAPPSSMPQASAAANSSVSML